MTSLIFDSTALIHFARAGRLAELRQATGGDEPVLLAEVDRELARGAPERASLDEATKTWFKPPVELAEMAELAAFASYKADLGGGPDRNAGEAAVLAWTSVNDGIAIIDEAVARNIAREDSLDVHGSLWLLIRSFNDGIHDRATIEGIVGDLIRSGMRLPFSDGTGFFPWAQKTGLLARLRAICHLRSPMGLLQGYRTVRRSLLEQAVQDAQPDSKAAASAA